MTSGLTIRDIAASDVDDLAAVRVERDDIFHLTHDKVLALLGLPTGHGDAIAAVSHEVRPPSR